MSLEVFAGLLLDVCLLLMVWSSFALFCASNALISLAVTSRLLPSDELGWAIFYIALCGSYNIF